MIDYDSDSPGFTEWWEEMKGIILEKGGVMSEKIWETERATSRISWAAAINHAAHLNAQREKNKAMSNALSILAEKRLVKK